jgi:8-amino-7-oxononanoate synthase
MTALVALAERFDAQIFMDDAHGLGVLGVEGRGTLSHLGIASPRILYMATLGKAAGVFGAFVAGPKDTIDWLEQRARTYMFTTGTPPVLAAAALISIDCMRVDEFRREHLRALGQQLQRGLQRGQTPIRGLTPLPSQTAIHPLLVGDNATVLRLSAALQSRGIWVPAIRPPTVPEGQARLRISLSAAHSAAQVEQLLTALRELA